MRIKCVGATSAGNCYILEDTKNQILVVDPGVKYSDILDAIDYDLERVDGVLVSHSHSDHSKSAAKFAVPVYQPNQPGVFKVGQWVVQAMPVQHDVATYAFFIQNPDGNVLYVTDAGDFPYNVKAAHYIMIEANYCDSILMDRVMKGAIDGGMMNRIRNAHLSIDQACDFLARTDLTETKGIMLLHLSNANSNAEQFQKRVYDLTGLPTIIADKNVEVTWL